VHYHQLPFVFLRLIDARGSAFSYLFVFYDQAWWLNYQLEEQDLDDHPSGLGAGINLRTTFGNFNLAWAVGRAQQQQLGLAQSKIHFGYVTTF